MMGWARGREICCLYFVRRSFLLKKLLIDGKAIVRAQMEAPETDRFLDRELIGHITYISYSSFLQPKSLVTDSVGLCIYSTIVFAAQDTSASATSRTLHRLAEHPEAQARLRAEIRSLRTASSMNEDGDGDGNENDNEEPWNYDALMRLPYLDAVVRETLRLHGPVSWIWRMCVSVPFDSSLSILQIFPFVAGGYSIRISVLTTLFLSVPGSFIAFIGPFNLFFQFRSIAFLIAF